MSIRWLIIFFVLAIFILIDSNGLPANCTKNGQMAEGDSANNINYSNERLNSLSEVIPSNSKVSTETRKIPTCLNQERIEHRGNKNEKISKCAEKNYEYLINALSKIAKVRSSQEDPVVIRQHSMANVFNDAKSISTYLQSRVPVKNIGGPTSFDTKSSSKLISEDTFNNTPNGELQRENFHCHAIRDIYIPEVKEKIPSYACTFGDGHNTFILSSKRFFQDRRNNFHINIDNDMLRKLNRSTITPTNSQFNIIPAVLVLKPWHENYYIRNPQNYHD